jgi:hypothetical protein
MTDKEDGGEEGDSKAQFRQDLNELWQKNPFLVSFLVNYSAVHEPRATWMKVHLIMGRADRADQKIEQKGEL